MNQYVFEKQKRRIDIPFALIAVVVLFLVAVAIKAGALWVALQEPLGRVPVSDSANYFVLAKSLADTQQPKPELFYTTPGYPIFLAMLFGAAGPSLTLVALIQALFGIGSLALVFVITRQLAPAPAPFFAVALALLYGPLTFLEPYLLPTVPAIFFALLSLRLVMLAMAIRKFTAWLAAGAVSAIAAVLLPQLYIFPVLLGAALLLKRPEESTSFVEAPVAMVSFLLGFFLFIAPVALIRYSADQSWHPWPWGGGVVLAQGNQLGSNGTFNDLPEFSGEIQYQAASARALAEKESRRKLRNDDVSRHFVNKVLSNAMRYPGRFAVLVAKKLALTASSLELGQNYDWGPSRKENPFLSGLVLPFSVLFFLGWAGLFWGLRRSRNAAPAVASALVMLLTCLLFFVTTRHRLPLAPLLAIGSGCFLGFWIDELRERGFKTNLSLILIPLVLATGLFLFPWSQAAAGHGEVHHFYQTGYALEREGRLAEAQDAYLAALRIDPAYTPAVMNMARIAVANGDPEEAETFLRRGVAMSPGRVDVRSDLAVLLASRGKIQEAVDQATQAVKGSAVDYRPHLALARVLWKSGNQPLAWESMKRAEELDPNALAVITTKAEWARESKDVPGAMALLTRALTLDPMNAKILNDLGRMVEDQNIETAIGYYKKAAEADPRMAEPWINLARIYAVKKGDKVKALEVLTAGKDQGAPIPILLHP